MPWIEYVTVKEALAADSAVLRPVDEARRDLTEKARRAVEGLAEAKVMKVTTPVRASLRAVPPASLAVLEGIPGLDYSNGTLSFVTDDMREAYDGLVAVVGVATTAYVEVLGEVLRGRADGEDIRVDHGVALTRRWFDQESGRLVDQGTAGGEPVAEGRYHGYR